MEPPHLRDLLPMNVEGLIAHLISAVFRNWLHEEFKLREDHVKNIEELLQFRNVEIQEIHKSISWQILRKYENFLHKLFPLGTRRRHYYELILGGLRSGPSPLERALDQNKKTDNIHLSENRDQHSSSE